MSYIHGFNETEQQRLVSQAGVLEPKIFEKINFSGCKRILEVGCGVGAQTEILLHKYPDAHVTGIELSEVQLQTARNYLSTKFSEERYALHQMNAQEMTLDNDSFDAVYICWVLEHVEDPQRIIDECYRVLKPGGVIAVTEVQNNNLYLVPASSFLSQYWKQYNALQMEMKGNPFVGVEVGNFLKRSGFPSVDLYSQAFLYDDNQPEKREILVTYWTNLLLSGFDNLLEYGRVKASDRERISREMSLVKAPGGVFHYAFIQGLAKK